jgi:integrase
MAYEWCQRIGDMRLLTWQDLDLDKGQLTLEQSKRRSKVFLPISDDLYEMLLEQKADFGFQRYVAPNIKPIQGEYHPYGLERVSKIAKRVMKHLNMPDELKLMDLRRTGETEMVDSGVPMGQIMSVTGHTNVQSVKPYLKHTFESAKNALNTRRKYNA